MTAGYTAPALFSRGAALPWRLLVHARAAMARRVRASP